VFKVKTTQISEETRIAILDAAWDLIAASGRLDVGQAEIAAKAGVSRQTIYLAFGNRAGLLMAVLRNRDTKTGHVARLLEIAGRSKVSAETFLAFIDTWLDYLPIIYPVGIQVDAAALNDREAAAAWDDRMKALLHGMKSMLNTLEASGALAEDCTAARAADVAWSLIHPSAWRLLVIERGWKPGDFRKDRLRSIERLLLRKPAPTSRRRA
jgi:AcrR family transcriptional regulator